MGAGYTVFSCSSCGFGNGFYIGLGRSHKTLEDVIVKVHPKRRSKILELLDKHTVHETDFEHRIYLCGQCGESRNSLWVRIAYDNDQIYETQFKCDRCNKAMVNISDQIKENKTCPHCGSDHLSYAEDLLWD